MADLHPSVRKQCVPAMLAALGDGWILSGEPKYGLTFKHTSGWEMRVYWAHELSAFRPSYDCRVPFELVQQGQQAAAAGTALVKLQGWDDGHPVAPLIAGVDYASLEARVFAQMTPQERMMFPAALRPKEPVK